MNTYIYTGQDEIEVVGYGIVKQGDSVTVPFEISHPLFKPKKAK